MIVLGFGIQFMGAASEFGHAPATWDIAQVARTSEGQTLLKRYLTEITEGPAFKGSTRSAQFLEYIIWQSAAGKMADLKERTIGVKLFGRTPAYDTGEDAIVRVTASDVRKRLVQHYSGVGNASEFRIGLPSGGYVPELIRTPKMGTEGLATQLSVDERPVEPPAQRLASRAGARNERSTDWKYWILPILGFIAL